MIHQYITFVFTKPDDVPLAIQFMNRYTTQGALPHQRLHYALSDDGLTAAAEADWSEQIGDEHLAALAAYLFNPPASEDAPPSKDPPPKDPPKDEAAVITKGDIAAKLDKSDDEIQEQYGSVKQLEAKAEAVFVALIHDGDDSREQAGAYQRDVVASETKDE